MTQAQAENICQCAKERQLDTSKVEDDTLERVRFALQELLPDVIEAVNLRRTLRGADPIRS